MSRYAVPIVLLVWIALAVMGCNWVETWLALLGLAMLVQAVATIARYRDYHRRMR